MEGSTEQDQEHVAPRPLIGIAGALVVDPEPKVHCEQRRAGARETDEEPVDRYSAVRSRSTFGLQELATFEKSSATFRASKCSRLSRGYKLVLRR
jgi:hypothetical protein